MKYKLLSVNEGSINNIGDYIQALAASKFLPQIDGFINRESLSDYTGERSMVIMNGWFMHHPEKWPPSDNIIPLFVAFHLNKLASSSVLSEEGIEYLKKHEPIGCRDIFTRDTLLNKGIDAYFSGCLTLTLGNSYSSSKKSGEVFFVDPIIPRALNPLFLIKDFYFLLLNLRSVLTISKKSGFSRRALKNIFLSSRFFRIYKKIFDVDVLTTAKYINQESSYYTSTLNTDEMRLIEAERLVKEYAEASFIVTSRIHCALPSLGLGTPVYFLENSVNDEVSKCRFGGLVDLFNVIESVSDSLVPKFKMSQKLSRTIIIQNKDSWRHLAKDLTERCRNFVESNEE